MRYLAIIAIVILLLPFSAQAFSFEFVHQDNYPSYDQAGFFSGIWHGLIAPYSLIVRLFASFNTAFAVQMYAYSNTGWFYDFGFILGITTSIPIGWLAAFIAFIAILV